MHIISKYSGRGRSWDLYNPPHSQGSPNTWHQDRGRRRRVCVLESGILVSEREGDKEIEFEREILLQKTPSGRLPRYGTLSQAWAVVYSDLFQAVKRSLGPREYLRISFFTFRIHFGHFLKSRFFDPQNRPGPPRAGSVLGQKWPGPGWSGGWPEARRRGLNPPRPCSGG